MSRPERLLVPTLLAFMAGCGGLEDRAPAPDPDAIRIGCIRYQQGDLIDDMYSYGAALAVAEINRQGGVLGRPLQFLANSDRPGSPGGLQGTRDLLRADVVAIIGGPTSALHLEMVQLTAPLGVPLVSPSATSPALSELAAAGTLSFRVAPSDALQGRFLADRVYAEGIRTMGILYRDDAYGSGLMEAFRDRFTTLGGRLTAATGYDSNSTVGLRRRVEALLEAGIPEGILLLSFSTDGTALSQHLAALLPRPMPRFFGTDGINNLAFFQNAEPEVVEGVYGSTPAFPDSPAVQAFQRSYLAELGAEATPTAAFAYDAVYTIALAVAAEGQATPAAVRNQIRRVTGGLEVGTLVTAADLPKALELLKARKPIDFQGLTGRLDLDAKGDPTQTTYAWWRYRKGVVEILTVSEVTGASAPR